MNKYLRRSLIGLLCGLVSSIVLTTTLRNPLLGIFVGVLVGMGVVNLFGTLALWQGCGMDTRPVTTKYKNR